MTNPQQQFIADIYPAAKKVAEESGKSLELILAQTAQESGWGQKTLEGTNNLFNVKADAPGTARPRSSRFRSTTKTKRCTCPKRSFGSTIRMKTHSGTARSSSTSPRI